jgi:hypothetical protein
VLWDMPVAFTERGCYLPSPLPFIRWPSLPIQHICSYPLIWKLSPSATCGRAISEISLCYPTHEFLCISFCPFYQIQWTLELRTVWCSNNLKLEQKIRGKSGFETLTKTRKSNKELRGRHVVAFSLRGRTRSCSVSSPLTGWVSISQISLFFKRFIYLFIYLFGLFLYYL